MKTSVPNVGGRPAKLYEFGGAKLSLTDWAEVSGVPKGVIVARLKLGWSFADSVIYLPREVPPGRERPGRAKGKDKIAAAKSSYYERNKDKWRTTYAENRRRRRLQEAAA